MDDWYQATKALEKLKSELQKDVEPHKAVAGSNVGCYAILWFALDELVNKCLSLGEQYFESLAESDEPVLQDCIIALQQAEKALRQVALIIGQALTEQAEEIPASCRSEINAFQACVYIKMKLRSARHLKR
ncbi:MAG: hypothetical protein WCA07_09840 [Gloeobacterales cyanobacterium]